MAINEKLLTNVRKGLLGLLQPESSPVAPSGSSVRNMDLARLMNSVATPQRMVGDQSYPQEGQTIDPSIFGYGDQNMIVDNYVPTERVSLPDRPDVINAESAQTVYGRPEQVVEPTGIEEAKFRYTDDQGSFYGTGSDYNNLRGTIGDKSPMSLSEWNQYLRDKPVAGGDDDFYGEASQAEIEAGRPFPNQPVASDKTTITQADVDKMPITTNNIDDQLAKPSLTDRFMSGLRENLNDPEVMASWAMAFNTMRDNPDPNVTSFLKEQLKVARTRKGNARLATQARKMGREDIALALESGQMTATQALTQLGKARYTQETGAEINKRLGTSLPPNALYNVSSTGSIKPVQEEQSAQATESSKLFAKEDFETIKTAQKANRQLMTIDETLKLLNKQGDDAPIVGFAQDIRKSISKALSLAGVDNVDQLSNTEYLEALTGSEVFPLISILGVGARGFDTPEERKFMQQSLTGSVTQQREALIRITQRRKEIINEAIEKYNANLNEGIYDYIDRPLKPIVPYSSKKKLVIKNGRLVPEE